MPDVSRRSRDINWRVYEKTGRMSNSVKLRGVTNDKPADKKGEMNIVNMLCNSFKLHLFVQFYIIAKISHNCRKLLK